MSTTNSRDDRTNRQRTIPEGGPPGPIPGGQEEDPLLPSLLPAYGPNTATCKKSLTIALHVPPPLMPEARETGTTKLKNQGTEKPIAATQNMQNDTKWPPQRNFAENRRKHGWIRNTQQEHATHNHCRAHRPEVGEAGCSPVVAHNRDYEEPLQDMEQQLKGVNQLGR